MAPDLTDRIVHSAARMANVRGLGRGVVIPTPSQPTVRRLRKLTWSVGGRAGEMHFPTICAQNWSLARGDCSSGQATNVAEKSAR
jgi:hypothetical protein